MKKIETKIKTTTTLYDTNGKLISIIRKEQTIVETKTFIPQTREQGIQVRQRVEDYKSELEQKKQLRDAIEKGIKASQKKPKKFKTFTVIGADFGPDASAVVIFDGRTVTGVLKPGKSNWLMDQALKVYASDTEINKSPMKRKRLPKHHNRPRQN